MPNLRTQLQTNLIIVAIFKILLIAILTSFPVFWIVAKLCNILVQGLTLSNPFIAMILFHTHDSERSRSPDPPSRSTVTLSLLWKQPAAPHLSTEKPKPPLEKWHRLQENAMNAVSAVSAVRRCVGPGNHPLTDDEKAASCLRMPRTQTWTWEAL
ncbi:hypothetical protein NDU88_003170 [Pleurodeles waltl]|uniref:Uncharacterized protein n=1 Tax=Pleurodeles waltl TaxID=8319 RepID=A0AAV7PBC3_PLEWA|nr:hypothetical protein NDU88_003170 [Pleurodeles waltl]